MENQFMSVKQKMTCLMNIKKKWRIQKNMRKDKYSIKYQTGGQHGYKIARIQRLYSRYET